jgi:hypothetical protein
VYFTFVMERELFATAATLRNVLLSMLKPPPGSTELLCRRRTPNLRSSGREVRFQGGFNLLTQLPIDLG